MGYRVRPELLDEMGKYGAFDIKACFNCGNCTAVCPLSEGDDAFPRRVIRYAQLGLKDHLVANKELWLCYYCGECSDTCPRQAEPGEFMAAARRYAISSFDLSGFARRLYTSVWASAASLVLLAVIFGGIFLSPSREIPGGRVSTAKMLEFIPFELIHWVGIAVLAFMGIISAVTVLNMLWNLAVAPIPRGAPVPEQSPGPFPFRAAWEALRQTIVEVVGQKRYRDCNEDKYKEEEKPWYLKHWFIHWSIMIGFFGLAAATALDYLFKDPGKHVPLWYPIRLLGTVAGLLMMYGATLAIWNRLKKPDKYYAHSHYTDWIFVGLLWVVGATGFLLEIAIYLPIGGGWIYGVFLIHVALAMELLVLLPFTKFAHAVYRPVALWFYNFRRQRLGV